MNLTHHTAPSRPSAYGLISGWGKLIHAGALLFAAALSPSTYSPAIRRAVANRICRTAAQTIPLFILLAALFSLVLVHIVVVTAQSYGLSQFALGMVVRVLVVELLPLSAALYVALRTDSAAASEDNALPGALGLPVDTLAARLEAARLLILPRVLADTLTVVALIAFGGTLAMLLAYVSVYGVTPWGVAAFTRTVGQVFDPVVTLSLALKTLFFAVAVATIPALASAASARGGGGRDAALRQRPPRLFMVLIAIEMLALTAEFY